ncbi:MAG: hypothetical protein KGH50_03935, partial [Candidatus Micrarchaeota archaeon]|nr:hypothetical protein [Candidatus Micrarchaeota archaeon]
FNLIAPELIALFANSSVVNGAPVGMSSYREPLWDSVVSLEQDRGRRGMPLRRFKDMSDYVRTVSSFERIFDASSNGHMDFTQYGCVWWGARLKPDTRTIEIRSIDQQPGLKSLISATALVYGLASNLDGLHSHVAERSMGTAGIARIDAATNGFDAKIGGEPITQKVHELLEIGAKGLELSGEDPSFLDRLSDRLRGRENPADEARRIVERDGISSLIESRRI